MHESADIQVTPPAHRGVPPQEPVVPAPKSKRVVAAMALIALIGLGSVLAIGYLFVNQIREKRSAAAHAALHEAQQQR